MHVTSSAVRSSKGPGTFTPRHGSESKEIINTNLKKGRYAETNPSQNVTFSLCVDLQDTYGTYGRLLKARRRYLDYLCAVKLRITVSSCIMIRMPTGHELHNSKEECNPTTALMKIYAVALIVAPQQGYGVFR